MELREIRIYLKEHLQSFIPFETSKGVRISCQVVYFKFSHTHDAHI
jgi:hypothetical protein